MIIAKNQCSQCLFSKNKIVTDERKEEILKHCAEHDKNFICHKGTIEGGFYENLVCHGFYNENLKDDEIIKQLIEVGVIDLVNPNKL